MRTAVWLRISAGRRERRSPGERGQGQRSTAAFVVSDGGPSSGPARLQEGSPAERRPHAQRCGPARRLPDLRGRIGQRLGHPEAAPRAGAASRPWPGRPPRLTSAVGVRTGRASTPTASTAADFRTNRRIWRTKTWPAYGTPRNGLSNDDQNASRDAVRQRLPGHD